MEPHAPPGAHRPRAAAPAPQAVAALVWVLALEDLLGVLGLPVRESRRPGPAPPPRPTSRAAPPPLSASSRRGRVGKGEVADDGVEVCLLSAWTGRLTMPASVRGTRRSGAPSPDPNHCPQIGMGGWGC